MTDLTIEVARPTQPLPYLDSPPEPLPANKESLVKFALEAHRQFDENIWRNNPQAQVKIGDNQIPPPSYHNHFHVEAMIKSSKALIKAGKEGQDDLGLKKDLDNWNLLHPDQAPLTLDDLEIAVEIASAGHDLGNITKSASVAEQGGFLTLDFSDKYEALAGTPDIETRSADITEQLIDHFFAARLKPLIRHLIMQTVFNPQIVHSDQSFWQFIQYTDQIGTYHLSSQSRIETVAGLLNEMRVRGDPSPANFRIFLNFPEDRAAALIPDEEIKSPLAEILIGAQGHEIAPILRDIYNGSERPVDYEADIIKLITSI